MTGKARKQLRADVALVAASPLFDRAWYLNEYRDVALAGADPASHYVRHGAEEERDPGPGFSTAWYLSKYDDVRGSGMNPLVHYLRFGEKEGRLALAPVSAPPKNRTKPAEPKKGSPPVAALDAAAASYPEPALPGDHLDQPGKIAEAVSPLAVDIVICVHDALDDVRTCLDAVVRNRGENERLIVVDDGSGPETRDYLDAFMGDNAGDMLIRHNEALGYTRAANAGLRASTGDYVILLNSDTIVSSGWVEKLLEAGQRAADIGVVGPLSNTASWQSIPDVADPAGSRAVNALPAGLSVDDVSRRCAEWSNGVFPRVPLLNGFCLAIKRAVLDRVGVFDELAFPRGYGEEDDFMFRAGDAGFTGTVATHAFVFHAKSKSFSPEDRTVLAKEGGAILQSRYGRERVLAAVRGTRNNPQLTRMRELAKTLWEEPTPVKDSASELGETA